MERVKIYAVEVVGTYLSFKMPGWVVVTRAAWKEIYQEMPLGDGMSIGVILLTAVLVGITGIFITRRLTRTITSLKQANQTLQSLFDSSPLSIVMLDLDNRVLLWNNAAERTFGWNSQETLGKPLHTLLEGQLEEWDAIHHRILAGETVSNLEVQRKRKDGSIFFLDLSVAPVRDLQGNIYAQMSISRDITEHKRVEAELRTSEARYRALIESQVDLISRYRPDSTLTFVNDAYCQFYGKTREELIGNSYLSMVAPEFRERTLQNIRDMVKNPAPMSGEFLNYKRNGEACWIQWVVQGIADENGQIVEWQAIGRDITELKQAEAALRESEARLSLVFNNTSDLQVLLRVESDGRLVTQAVNRAYETIIQQLFPSASFNIIGRDRAEYLLDFGFPKELIEAETRLYSQVIESRTPVHYDTELPLPGGSFLALDTSIEPILNVEGQCTHVLWISRDVTERKQAEATLKQYSEQLETMVADRTHKLIEAQEQLVRQERLAVLGQLAGGVAHELRNPLGVLNNAVYFLKLSLAEADQTTKEYLDIISSRVYEAEKIITDLLNLSRTRPTEQYKIAITDLVGEVLAKQPPPERVKVATDIPIDLPPIFVDPGQLEQVLINLVVNAYQAMPEGGELTLAAQAMSDQVTLSVSDTGCGIAPQLRSKIFEPLFSTKPRGFGLGLTLSKNLVEINGGNITVSSTEGHGATFTITLSTQEVFASDSRP